MKKAISRIREWGNSPPRKTELYLGVVLPWFCTGILLCISVVFLIAVAWFGVLALAITMAMGFWCYQVDKKKGYIDVIHAATMKARQQQENPETPQYSK